MQLAFIDPCIGTAYQRSYITGGADVHDYRIAKFRLRCISSSPELLRQLRLIHIVDLHVLHAPIS